MKNNTLAIILMAAPAVSFAGEPMVSSKEPIPMPPPPPMCETAWFLGGGADYLLDAEEAYLNGHFGYDFGCGHSLFLEVGWVEQDQDFIRAAPVTIPGPPVTGGPPSPATTVFVPFTGSIDIEVIPVTLNYKYEYSFTDQFGFYIGGGLGASYIDLEANAGPFSVGDSDWSFTAQAFAGLVYNVTESFELDGGVRYLWIDEPTLVGTTFDSLDDFGVGGGIRFNF